MKEIVLKIKRSTQVPIECSCISPDSFCGKTKEEIISIESWEGNRKICLSDIFTIEGETSDSPDDLKISLIGDLSKFKRIGHAMTAGSIEVNGDVGMHLGEKMKGGIITVKGNAGSWVGSRMVGGSISILGNAGDFIGSAYRGSRNGMKGGSIVIEGEAGNEIGCWMRGGQIRIKHDVKSFPGVHMSGGTILIEGNCEGRAGAQMTGGKIVILGNVPSILPSFIFDEIREKAKAMDQKFVTQFYSFIGDINENGIGKIFVSKTNNPQLKWCESYLEKMED